MELKELLKKSFCDYIMTGYFFNTWYRENNIAYYFTFKENLSRTNIQYGELKSLIVSNISDSYNKQNCEIQFLTVQEFNTSIKSIVSSLSFDFSEYRKMEKNNSDPQSEINIEFNKLVNLLVENYFDILSRIIVIDPLYNSCCVYFPANIKINPKRIISMSGYINTCGELIHIRNFKKAKKHVLITSLNKILAKSMKKMEFNIFSYEDFKHTINNGCDIENLKIHIDKFFFDSEPLSSLLSEIEDKFKMELDVRFFYDQKLYYERSNKNSIWLVKDSSIGKEIRTPGERKYFICYLQLYKNENQLHLFDENKPAWKSNTTIPHTLMAAMINIAFEGKNTDDKIDIIDPFSGTGTTIIELLKYSSLFNISIYGGDTDLSNKIMLHDNLTILSYSGNELKDLINYFEKNKEECFTNTIILANNFNLIIKNQEEFEITKHRIADFQNLSIQERLLIYIFLKVKITDNSIIERKKDQFKAHFQQELDKLLFRLKQLIELFELEQDTSQTIHEGFKLLKGKFSSKVIIDSKVFKKGLDYFKLHTNDFAKNEDFRQLPKETYDIIICDPPYGFNTTQKIEKLLELYKDLPEFLISALKPYGQIVMSLPDESYSGKYSPWFTHKEMVIASFHFMSKRLNRRMFNYSEINPRKELFTAPFYWEAQRALRRSIIHLKFI